MADPAFDLWPQSSADRRGQGSQPYVLHPDQFGSPQLYTATGRRRLGPSMAEIRQGWPLAQAQIARNIVAAGGPFPRRRKPSMYQISAGLPKGSPGGSGGAVMVAKGATGQTGKAKRSRRTVTAKLYKDQVKEHAD